MSDRFDGVVPGRRGTDPPGAPLPDREPTPVERARQLVATLNERGNTGDYWRREELYESDFHGVLTDWQLEGVEGWQLLQPVNEDRGMIWELCAAGGGPVCGLLFLRWENGPFATLLLADAGA